MLSFSKVENSFGFVIQILIRHVLTVVSWSSILFIIVLDDSIWAGLIFLCRKFWHRLLCIEKMKILVKNDIIFVYKNDNR